MDFIDNGVLPKEITLLARRGPMQAVAPRAAAGGVIAREATKWLSDVLAAATETSRHRPFGVFGSSISAMWLFGALRERIDFFVDEDPARIGRECEGRPILHPRNAPSGAAVFVPLLPAIGIQVASRYLDAPARFVAPPARQA